jgi:hypothetical protein
MRPYLAILIVGVFALSLFAIPNVSAGIEDPLPTISKLNGVAIDVEGYGDVPYDTAYYSATDQNITWNTNDTDLDIGAWSVSAELYYGIAPSVHPDDQIRWTCGLKVDGGAFQFWPDDENDFYVVPGWEVVPGTSNKNWTINATVPLMGIPQIHIPAGGHTISFRTEMFYYITGVNNTRLSCWWNNLTIAESGEAFAGRVDLINIYSRATSNVLQASFTTPGQSVDGTGPFYMRYIRIEGFVNDTVNPYVDQFRVHIYIKIDNASVAYSAYTTLGGGLWTPLGWEISFGWDTASTLFTSLATYNVTATLELYNSGNWSQIGSLTGYIVVPLPVVEDMTSFNLMSMAFGLCGAVGMMFSLAGAAWMFRTGKDSVTIIASLLACLLLFGVITYVFLLGGT